MMTMDTEFVVDHEEAIDIVAKILMASWRDTHFSICAVDKALKVLGRHRPTSYGEWLRLHCVGWDQMPKGMPERLMASVVQELAGNRLSVSVSRVSPELILERMEGR